MERGIYQTHFRVQQLFQGFCQRSGQNPAMPAAKQEGAGEEVPAPWDASARIISNSAIKSPERPFVKDGSVTSR
jgi:hypothetical protein